MIHSALRPLDCHACQWIKLRLMAAGVCYALALAAIVHDHGKGKARAAAKESRQQEIE